MSTIYDFVTLGNQIEHDLEHTLEHKRQFSLPKIYSAKGDLSKRWYVYFSFRNPATGKLQRMKNIYGIANKFDTEEDRMTVLTCYRVNLIRLLKKGYSPFENNNELHKSLSSCNEQPDTLQSESTIEDTPSVENTHKKAQPVATATTQRTIEESLVCISTKTTSNKCTYAKRLWV